ncbi:MAG: hypothetical protein C5B50_23940 [Verrucomicrobia bacterium]|nr:MAG: hypothetical protein C5B50_23940 [Verrucomicrobiota bacterium]
MKSLAQLRIGEFKLAPGEEWEDATQAWRLLWLQTGVAYWLAEPRARSLSPGETLVVAPGVRALVRASQINDIVLHGFSFAPDSIPGLLSRAEQEFFETLVREKPNVLQIFPSTYPVSQQIAALASAPDRASLGGRAAALSIVAALFQEEMLRHRPQLTRASSAQSRFEQLIRQMPDGEFIQHRPAELARLCGCSPRHFYRLFREHFGESVRSRQTELRLLKASRLLSTTGDKVIQIALESGYRNLGLFNSLFKRRFGITPSQWRQKSVKQGSRRRRFKIVSHPNERE